MLLKRFVGVGLVIVAIVLSCRLGSAEGGGNDLAALRADCLVIRDCRDRYLAQVRERLGTGGGTVDAVTVRLTEFMEIPLFKPVEITVRMQRVGGRWLSGWANGWNGCQHEVGFDDLMLDGGRLKGGIRLRMLPDGWLPKDNRIRDYRVTVDAMVTAGVISGTYRRVGADEPEVVDEARGEVRVQRSIDAIPDLPPLPEDATGMERWALRAYRQLAVMAWMEADGFSWEQALAMVPEVEPARSGADRGAGRGYVALVRETLEGWQARGFAPAEYRVGTVESPDPDFGPYYGERILPSSEERPNEVPKYEDGPQAWAFVGVWKVLGPLPASMQIAFRQATLPPVLTSTDVACRVAFADPNLGAAMVGWENLCAGQPWSFADGDPARFAWGGKWLTPKFAGVAQPLPADQFHHGPDDQQTPVPPVQPSGWKGAFLACAEIYANEARRCWFGAQTSDYQGSCREKLWVNGALVWTTDAIKTPNGMRAAVFAADLRAGRNRLVLQCDHLKPFALGLCIRGTPRAEADAAAERAAVLARIAAVERSDSHIAGYWTDWRGHHPDADPVLAWDLERNVNVLWRTKLAGSCGGNPLVIGDRVYTCGDPYFLYCLDKRDGRVLWRRMASVFECYGEDPDKAERSRVAALFATKYEGMLQAIKDEKTSEEDRSRLASQVEEGKFRYESERAEARDWVRLATLVQWGNFELWWNYATWSTPVTDGKYVWVKYGVGVVACYDLDGNRRWLYETRAPRNGTRPSPLLVDGKLILIQPLGNQAIPGKRVGSPDAKNAELLALSADDGKFLWRTPIPCNGAWDGCYANTPVAMRLAAAGGGDLAVICINLGMVVRAEDGVKLIEHTGMAGTIWQIPSWDADRIFYPMPHGSVCSGRLIMLDRDTVGFQPLWKTLWMGLSTIQSHGQYMLHHGGLCYQMGVRPGTGFNMDWQEAAVIDDRSGEQVTRILPVFHEAGNSYAPHAQAGRWLFFHNHQGAAVVAPGRDPVVLLHNAIKPTWGTPAFDGDRVYYRFDDELVCLARKGEEGRIYEDRRILENLVSWVGSHPAVLNAEDLPPVEGFTPQKGVPVWRCSRSTAPPDWLVAGPLPRAQSDPVMAAGGAASLRPSPGSILESGSTSVTFAPLALEHVVASHGVQSNKKVGMSWYAERVEIDLTGSSGHRADARMYFYTVLYNNRPRIVQFNCKSGGLRSWLAGRPIRHEEKLRLRPGYYPLLLESTITKLPPPPIEKLAIAPLFVEVKSDAEEEAAWRKRLIVCGPLLRELVERNKASSFVGPARFLVRQLDNASK